ATRRNLELARSMRGTAQGSLTSVLDRSLTPMGGRLLHTWLNQPLVDRAAIESRLETVHYFFERATLRAELRLALKAVGDLQRMANRAAQGVALPRELVAFRSSLEKVPALAELLSPHASGLSPSAEAVGACREAA